MKNKNQMSILLCLVVALTNLSQLPIFIDSNSTQIVTYFCWGCIFLVCCLQKELQIKIKALNIISIFAVIIIIPIFFGMIAGLNYVDTRINYSLIITAGIFIISSFIPVFDMDDLNLVYRSYIISATVLAIVIYINYFLVSGFNFDSTVYEYGSKNSSSQIVLTAIILSIFDLRGDKKVWKILNFMCLSINMAVLLLMRSRASIIGIVIIVLMILLDKGIDKKIRRIVLAASVIFVCLMFFNENLYDTVINKILFASRDSTDLDDVSSGRYSQWEAFPQLFSENPIFGRGKFKIESFPLSVLVQYGALFGLPVIVLGIYPLIYAIKRRARGKHFQILMVTSAVYLLNGVFEELSPFGPGVKCYFVWMMLGILIRGFKYERELYSSNTKAGDQNNT